MALKSRIDPIYRHLIDPVARGLARLGATPNTLTSLGLVLTLASAWMIVEGRLLLGGFILNLGGIMDLLDGPVARARGRSTEFGAFYDSTADRIADGISLGAIAWVVRDEPLVFTVTLVALVSAQVTSYVRAKAESMGADCSVGLLERGERYLILLAALYFSFAFRPLLWVLAVGGTFTVVQRVLHVMPQLKGMPTAMAAVARSDDGREQ